MIPAKRSRGWEFVKSNFHKSNVCLNTKLVKLNALADRAHVIFTLLAKPLKWILAILGTKTPLNDTCAAIERLRICHTKSSWIVPLLEHKARESERTGWSRTRHFYSLSEAFKMNIGDFGYENHFEWYLYSNREAKNLSHQIFMDRNFVWTQSSWI